jgi:EmrB/QacA subfamily drug resistance transporter
MSTSLTPKTVVNERHNWLALAVLLVGAFMALLDTTIVNVAIPAIRTSLAASNATLSWIVSGYALAFGLALIPAGRVGDRLGHKWVFIVGLSLFTIASLACGLARDDMQLITARAVQGLAGGMFFTPITALIQLMFADRKRARAFAVLGATIGFSVALGPLIGGLIIQASGTDTGWRLVFDVNIPLGVLAVIAAVMLLPTGDENSDTVADWLGLGLLSAGLVALLTPLIQGQQEGWPLWTYASIGGAIALLTVFALWERRVEKTGADPLVPPRLFAHPAFTGGVLLALVYFAAFTSIFFTIALLWQAGLGHTALQSGLVLTPFAIGLIGGASQSDALAARFGRTVLMAGLGVVAAGITGVWLLLALTPATSYSGWQLVAPLLAAGVGSGLFIAPNVDFIVATVDPGDAGAASGVIGTAQRVGSAIGIAIIGTVLFGTLNVNSAGRNPLAVAFGHSATLAMAASAALSVAAFGLVFALPKRTGMEPTGVSERVAERRLGPVEP